MRGAMQKTFLGLAKDSQSLVDTEDYHCYRLCLRAVFEDFKDYMRVCIKENHFTSKTEQEFRAYTALKIDAILQIATDTLNDLYHGKIISRATLYKENQKIVPDIRVMLTEIYFEARNIATRAEVEVDQQERAFDLYFTETIGV